MKKYIFPLLIFFLAVQVQAQSAAGDQPEMANSLYSSGKIYVVITVLLVILAGIFIYLFMLDRKVGKLERKMKETK